MRHECRQESEALDLAPAVEFRQAERILLEFLDRLWRPLGVQAGLAKVVLVPYQREVRIGGCWQGPGLAVVLALFPAWLEEVRLLNSGLSDEVVERAEHAHISPGSHLCPVDEDDVRRHAARDRHEELHVLAGPGWHEQGSHVNIGVGAVEFSDNFGEVVGVLAGPRVPELELDHVGPMVGPP